MAEVLWGKRRETMKLNTMPNSEPIASGTSCAECTPSPDRTAT